MVNVILELASPDNLDEYRTEAVAVSSSLASLAETYSQICPELPLLEQVFCALQIGKNLMRLKNIAERSSAILLNCI